MQTDIVNFLPKYPNIYKLDEEILNPYEGEFYETIFKKKEFYDEKLEAVEQFPEEVGSLLKHQKIISRFFSPHTMYNTLLLLHPYLLHRIGFIWQPFLMQFIRQFVPKF